MKKFWEIVGYILVLIILLWFIYLFYELIINFNSLVSKIKDPTTIILWIIALIWYFLKYYFDRKFSLSEEKRKVYKEFVELFIFVLNKSKDEEKVRNNNKLNDKQKLIELEKIDDDFLTRLKKSNWNAILYFPSNIIISRKEFLITMKNQKNEDSVKNLLLLSNLLLLIRKDIWLDNSKIKKTWDELLIFFLSDYEKHFN